MASRERIPVHGLEELFADVEAMVDKSVTKTVIGQLPGGKLVRIKRVADRTLEGEANYRTYEVDLLSPYDPGRLKDVAVIISTKWKITPQMANQETVLAESRGDEYYAIFPAEQRAGIEKPEDIFGWYDRAVKSSPAETPNIQPNIYTPEGMEELIRQGDFKGADDDQA